MSFQDDVRKQIAKNIDAQAAKQTEKERMEAERISKMINQASSCASAFYNKCVEAASHGKHGLTMYAVDLSGMFGKYGVELITAEKAKEAIESPSGYFTDYSKGGIGDDAVRWANALPVMVAETSSRKIQDTLRNKGLANAVAELYPRYKYIEHPPSFFHSFGWKEKTNEIVGYFIRITASW